MEAVAAFARTRENVTLPAFLANAATSNRLRS
jgi:hypothetical protein